MPTGIITPEVNNMVSGKRWLISMLVLTLLTVSGAAVWLYCGQLPKKEPLRARPVFADTLDNSGQSGQKCPAPTVADEHNNRNIEHTMAVPPQ